MGMMKNEPWKNLWRDFENTTDTLRIRKELPKDLGTEFLMNPVNSSNDCIFILYVFIAYISIFAK